MMKHMLVFLFVSSAFAVTVEQQLNICEKEGQNFGSGKGKDSIPSFCLDYFRNHSLPQAVKRNSDGSLLVYGHRNMVFLEGAKRRVLAGKYTELEDVVAVAPDDLNKEVVVLEKSGDVLSFSNWITGNVAPYRILRSKELEGAVDLVANGKRGEIVVLNGKSKSVLVYSRLANIHAPEGKKKLDLLRSVRGVEATGLAIDEGHQEVFLLDAKNRKIVVLDAVKLVKVRSLVVPVQTVRLEYSGSQEMIKAIGVDGKRVEVKRVP